MEEYENLGAFLEHVSLVMDNEAQADEAKVTIMTIHAAKGLEFDTVFLAGWFFSAAFELERGPSHVTLGDLLRELGTRVEVYVLAWAGAPLPLFRPSRGNVRKMRDQLIRGTNIQCGLDSKERPLHCHHEKTIVIDGRIMIERLLDRIIGPDLGIVAAQRMRRPCRDRILWISIGQIPLHPYLFGEATCGIEECCHAERQSHGNGRLRIRGVHRSRCPRSFERLRSLGLSTGRTASL
jgi:hypothetical protein